MTLREVDWRLKQIAKRQNRELLMEASMRGIQLPADVVEDLQGDETEVTPEEESRTEKAISERLERLRSERENRRQAK